MRGKESKKRSKRGFISRPPRGGGGDLWSDAMYPTLSHHRVSPGARSGIRALPRPPLETG